jgi:16S rRNA (cytidine1402-2'-O)-methyltransferase
MDHTLKSGLYLISTPIGNLKDITLRALETLKACDVIFCEDTRVTSKLLNAYGIKKTLYVYQEHNEADAKLKIFEFIQKGQAVGLVSDAGTPLISDPGFKLLKFLNENGVYVTILPGACAFVSGLCLSSMPTNKFSFLGFFDAKHCKYFTQTPGSLIFYESPKRLLKTLSKLEELFPNREVAVVREISKIYEEVVKGTYQEVIENFTKRDAVKGEIVIVLSPPLEGDSIHNDELLRDYIKGLLKDHSVKDSAVLAHLKYGVSKKHAYNLALEVNH